MRLILLGPPGVGKGTQAQILMEEVGAIQLSTGDLLRSVARESTAIGREVKRHLDAGELIPDDIILEMIHEELMKLGETSLIFDGFPRTVPQAEGLDHLLEEMSLCLDHVIELTIEPGEVVKRLSSRRSCPECGAVYNLVTAPPVEDNVCDSCGHAGLIQRDDDKPEVIERRLEIYHRQTAPVAEHYRETGLLRVVDGAGSLEEVSDRIRRSIKLMAD